MEKINNAISKIKGWFGKETLVNTRDEVIMGPWYIAKDSASTEINRIDEIDQFDNMKPFTGGRYPPVPDLYGPEIKLPPIFAEKLIMPITSPSMINHPSYCECLACKQARKEMLVGVSKNRLKRETGLRFQGVDLSPEYYGAGSKTNYNIPYVGPAGVTYPYPKLNQFLSKK